MANKPTDDTAKGVMSPRLVGPRSRSVRIPSIDWSKYETAFVCVPVKVDWPELQLTEAQVLANAVALANGEDDPFPDPSIFTVEIERPKGV